MSPEHDWRYPRADMYLLYSLKQSPPYNCSAPFWRDIREEIFTELKRVVNKPTIYHLTLVKHSKESFALPIGQDCPSYYGFFFLEASGADLINTKNDSEYSHQSACKDLGITHPHLINWFERNKRWHKVKDNSYYYAGNRFYSTVIPQMGSTYFHVEYRDD